MASREIRIAAHESIKDLDLMTSTQASAYTGFSENFLYGVVKCKELPTMKAGKLYLFRRSDLDAWLGNYGVYSYTPKEAAEILNLAICTIISALTKGVLKGRQFNRLWRISEEDLIEYKGIAHSNKQEAKGMDRIAHIVNLLEKIANKLGVEA